MNLLLDTHVWLWSLVSPERIAAEALAAMVDPENPLYLSAASSWEIAIKYRLGKLTLPEPPSVFVPLRLSRDGIVALPVEHPHAVAVADLPDHHNDPFDRLLIAQATLENMKLVTNDVSITNYDVDILRA